MSWLQSSLGFVNSALSQAQKSIDKVLDISEDSDLSTKESNRECVRTYVSCVYRVRWGNWEHRH